MRILVVEDEKEIGDFLKKGLESEYFSVDVVMDGKEGSHRARYTQYDIIILDHILPGKNGLQICREIRDAKKTMPIILLSVQSEVTTKVDLLNAGADDYLTKPFSFDELLARIHSLLRRPLAIQDDLLSIDTLKMDVQKHVVTRNNTPIHLTRKEFMLLEYLLRNKGYVLSRGMIMEHVWDMHADPFSNTIESHVTSLRRKIDYKQPIKLIYTIAGCGYKIDITT